MSRSLPFDPLAALPTGTTLLEASAGTGKTYTIAALATRYIAEGITTIDEMLIITFGRSATRELRERVRESLTRARDALRSGTPQTDVVIQQLLSLPQQERQAAADRLARAVADFDAGTIATTHQFCMHALAGLGIIADTDPGEVFVESITDLIDEVVDDFYVRKYGGPRQARRGSPTTRPSDWPARQSVTHRQHWTPARSRPRRSRRPGSPSHRRFAMRSCVAAAPADWSPSTIWCCACRTPSPTTMPGSGCGRTTRSCWLMSSRTPTRPSGASCATRSTATGR